MQIREINSDTRFEVKWTNKAIRLTADGQSGKAFGYNNCKTLEDVVGVLNNSFTALQEGLHFEIDGGS